MNNKDISIIRNELLDLKKDLLLTKRSRQNKVQSESNIVLVVVNMIGIIITSFILGYYLDKYFISYCFLPITLIIGVITIIYNVCFNYKNFK